MDEFELIRKYFYPLAQGSAAPSSADKSIILGMGDDCALLQMPPDKQLVVSVDTLVEGVHFPPDAPPELVAQRALRVNLSDLAAMGAEPLWFTLSVTMPDVNEPWLKSFSQGLASVSETYACRLVGGNTTRGPLNISVQVHGAVDGRLALRRSGARVGDTVFVTGTLGDGAGALAVIQGDINKAEQYYQYFQDHYYKPIPRLKEGELLGSIATAAIDISDGLLADLGHICDSSEVGAVLYCENIPLSEALLSSVDRKQALEWALCGGDDYQLCFTVVSENRERVYALIEAQELQAVEIGKIVQQPGIACSENGRPIQISDLNISNKGYQHFG